MDGVYIFSISSPSTWKMEGFNGVVNKKRLTQLYAQLSHYYEKGTCGAFSTNIATKLK
jgi:hypothetical protein